jgi:hypothetical protein
VATGSGVYLPKVRHNQYIVRLSWAGYRARMAEIVNIPRVMQSVINL